MIITAIAWNNEEQTMLKVTTSDLDILTVPQPCETWHGRDIQAWLDAGGSITAFVDPIDYMALMRTERNNRLTKSDWTQLADSTADKTAWATYRQALRDMPQNNPNTNTKSKYAALVWPTQPE